MGCTHNCDTCGESCGSKSGENTIPKEELNKHSKVKKVIGIVSGKGGVGKSLVTSAMAVSMNRRGYKTAVMDADITGPSIPKAFGLTEKCTGSDLGIFPGVTKTGIKVMSINLLLENDTDPVVWRGPVIAG
ncbi:MAG: P-loop NTPase, partial [Ruminococcus sp.]